MVVDILEDWMWFSEHEEKYIEEQTPRKYGLGEAQEGTFYLISTWKLVKREGVFSTQ